MSVHLDGLAVAKFRGTGPTLQRIYPFSSFNFFIGQNNSGKSTVLDFIYRYIGSVSGAKRPTQELDAYNRGASGPIQRAVAFKTDRAKVAKFVVEQEADLSVYDLKRRITELAKSIRAANQ